VLENEARTTVSEDSTHVMVVILCFTGVTYLLVEGMNLY
jgi:hypothetical protein